MKSVLKSVVVFIACFIISINSITVNATNKNTVDSLYMDRLKLVHNYNKNINKIRKIDKNINKMKCSSISEEEVMNLIQSSQSKKYNTSEIGSKKRIINRNGIKVPPKERGITWRSQRQNAVYNGKLFEVQIITGIPTGSGNLTKTDVIADLKYYGRRTALSGLIKSVAVTKAGEAPIVGKGLSIYDAVRSYCNGLRKTSTIENISAVYTINRSTNLTLVFVKFKGESDQNQILGYAGNSTFIHESIVIPSFKYSKADKMVRAGSRTIKNTEILQSKGYNNKVQMACKYYYNYKNKKKNKDYHYNIRTFKVTTLRGKTSLKIPHPNYGF